MEVPDVLQAIASDQDGVITRAQALASGVTPGALRWQLGRTWRLLLPGVVMLEPGLPSNQQRLVAALLFAGPRSWLAGPTAALLHEIPGVTALDASRRVHVLVAAPCRPRDASWVSIRRTHLVDERIVERGPLRYSCRARAVVDAAALAVDEDTTRAIIIGAIQERLVRPDDLSHWIEARSSRGRRRLRRAFAEAVAGAWSVPEADLLRLIRTSTVLPEPMANPELEDDLGRRLTSPDVWFDDVAMAVMVQSKQFHEGALDWEATVEAGADLGAARVVVVPVTPGSIARNPSRVLERIERAHADATRSGQRAPVVAKPRATPVHAAPDRAPLEPGRAGSQVRSRMVLL